MSSKEGWEAQAANWAAWARTPGHDSYWQFRNPFFDEIVPPPGRATLEVGCGEGRVARDLRDRGHSVTAVDASPTLIELAREVDPDSTYVVADVAELPFDDGSFDLAVAFNSFMVFDDVPAAARELARVLVPGGRLAVSITHPVADAGRFENRQPDARFVIAGSYYQRRWVEDSFDRDGLPITFYGWTHPLEDYTRALEDAGFLIERIREPQAPVEAAERDPSDGRWQRLPNFLHLRALRP